MREIVFGVLATLASLHAHGAVAVDPFEQALIVDLNVDNSKEGLRVRYSSRSTYRGLFGFGWCSPLDGRVVVRHEGSRERLLYYGCDLRSGRSLDPRVAGYDVRRQGLAFSRMNENGQTVEFDSNGRVVKIGTHFLKWFDGRLIYRSIESEERVLTLGTWYGGLKMVTRIGSREFSYSEEGLLISDSIRVITYNRYRNIVRMQVRADDTTYEEYSYDDARDRLRVITRQTVNGVERLWLDVRGDGVETQGKNEIEMELRRGAEMRPVRILYNHLRGAIRIDGGQAAVSLILGWLRGRSDD